ncbi:MAG TPA: trigger factor [Chlamydiales bacterium]|nr:trigger factor [Chlamydiales bacterium]
MTQATHDHEELTSEEVRVRIYRKPACRVEMSVKTTPVMLKEARKNAIKTVSKEVALPGFRKGRAPDEIILKKFPADVEKQRHKALADLAFVAAQKIAKVPVLNSNSPVSFDLKHESEEGAEMLFSFETEPAIPTVDPSGFVAKPVARPEVAEKQLEEAIRQMRFFYAQWKPIHNRPIQDGDYIMIDLDTVEGDVVQKVFHHIRFEVSKERMASWMQKLVQGAKAGDVLDGVSEPDDNASDEEKKEFKPKNVRLSVLKVEEATLPELDDEFAKKVGATDVAHMRQSISDLLNKQADEKVNNEMREQVNEFLIQKYAFDLPQSLIETEKKHRINQLAQDPKFKANWQKMSQEERKALEEKLTAESNQAVRLFYLSRQLVYNEKIPVTHLEVQQEAISMYQSHSGGRNAEIDQLPKEIYALALSKVILAKAQDFVLKYQKP